jgi:hypothetical protein
MNLKSLLYGTTIPVDANFHFGMLPITIDPEGNFYPAGIKVKSIDIKNVSVGGNTPTLILDENSDRVGHFLISSSPFYVGIDGSVNDTNGIYISSNTKFSFDINNICYCGKIYAYASSSITIIATEYTF